MKFLHFIVLNLFIVTCLFAAATFSSAAEADIHNFQSNAKDLLSIFSRSIYKKPSDFIRELLSNAADALNIKRLSSLTLGGGSTEEYKVSVICNPIKKELMFIDTGCGMDDVDMRANLGTFAKSGTKEKMQQIKATNSSTHSELIGQFGLGFYSAFIVADTVTVVSKKHSSDGTAHKKYVWNCNINDGNYTIKEIKDDDPLERSFPISSGTKVILHISDERLLRDISDELADDEQEKLDFLDPDYLKELIIEYSQYISYPIYLVYNKTVTSEVPLDVEEEKPSTHDEEIKVEEEDDESKAKKTTKTVTSEEVVTEKVNIQKPIWADSSSSVTAEQYNTFYKTTFKESSDPIIHQRGSGSISLKTSVDFQYLIYIPKTPSFQPFSGEDIPKFLKLYVKRVFVTDEFGEMFPRYLSFIRGVVDVEDLPLNVSRESLQDLTALKSVFKYLANKVVGLIHSLSKNITAYEPFYKQYSGHIKLGIIVEKDQKRKDSLVPLLHFKSSHNVSGVFLDEYISRMPEMQTEIYFVTGSSVKEMRKLPQIEMAIKKGYEVLYLDESFDEYLVQATPTYKGKVLRNLAKSGVNLSDESEKQKLEEAQKRFKPLTAHMQKLFASTIEKVVVSGNLDRSPVAISASANGISPQMEKLLKANKNDFMAQYYLGQKKILEINPEHPLIQSMLDDVVSASEPVEESDKNMKLLYYSALLHSGYEISNPAEFSQAIEDMLRSKYGLSSTSKREETQEDLFSQKENPMFSFPNMEDFGLNSEEAAEANLDEKMAAEYAAMDAAAEHEEI
ncbi:hypothetical protein MDAP_001655 [Mitosporidium daphniae]|uniref:Putative endoplasmin/endoplasmic reticulum glucose-regulated protein Grp94 n=1 Tax=Mitosporidium daphniae TaxID=1485682 RepID=A0A098VPV8_9MICR|nr:putative endoplasmin/endoplasmic reticulum glucose-regulated protein Grp94 [Mitosporidium daphniae]KGG51005.1 putative endoplasmin/endoplasmic reticulum glucose-regulated protein Grp94 [Mitosporidium daphniae]|eukprot:XP_013237432.1 putative endoplasmin/endoplasmic reticulum glucose-regulated protein Grp94 [Mitosporidium daphniae]